MRVKTAPGPRRRDYVAPRAKDAGNFAVGREKIGVVLEAFGVWVEKQMYGKTYMGIERATFLFDANGVLVRAWHKVRVPGHVAEVLEAVRAIA